MPGARATIFIVAGVIKPAHDLLLLERDVHTLGADRAAAKPQVGRRYRLLRNRGRCGRGVSCRHRYGGHKDGSEKTQK